MSQEYLWLSSDTWQANLPRPTKGLQSRLKRLADIVLVLALSPLAALLVGPAVLALLATGQRPFYHHTRMGRGAVPFRCFKLRTMLPCPSRALPPTWLRMPDQARELHDTGKLTHDPRISRLGHWLRRTSIDELPQLLNVLRGEMSLVGPRPITAAELGAYLDHQRQAYFRVRPGLTGLWQVSGRSDLTLRQRARLDTVYARAPSLLRDLRILLKTVPVVLRCSGV